MNRISVSENISYYSKNAAKLEAQYNNLSFEQVHQDWIAEIPDAGFALDIGAGSGRDARFLASKGLRVVAVEPARGIRERAQRYTANHTVHWLEDKLPDLKKVFKLQTKYDLILLSAVWMHIPPSDRERCIRKLSTLLKANGKIVISLRYGGCDDGRTMFPVSVDELSEFAGKFGLTFSLLSQIPEADQLGREAVTWQTVMLTLPDDGTGSFPLLRNIIVNDSKSSTYKVALLRSLLRIAEGHPGAVIEQTKDHVVLPLGLVALYWIKLFKPLIDTFQLPQSSNASRGLGFIKNGGWNNLTTFSAHDFYVGATYSDPQMATYLYQTLKDVASTIKNMPAKYITLPGSDDRVFQVELTRNKKPTSALVLDFNFLSSIGKLYVPATIWDSLARFSVWIEPSLINEWAALMQTYGASRSVQYSSKDFLSALAWENPARSTSKVRSRIDHLLMVGGVHCCWTGNNLRTNRYDVDHAMPFSRWPNNDLWNLLPATSQINSEKSDKLPSAKRLLNSASSIKHWWKDAWSAHSDEFFVQANLALPSLNPNNKSFDDVFEAMALQRDRIRDFQQLREW